MKRYGNLYDKIIDIDNLRLAHKNARKNKTKYKEIVEVDKDPEYYIQKLHKMLVEGKYVCSPYEMFIKNDSGKEREIFRVPYYPDRILQHAIMQVVEPIWKKTLINDTFQAIKGRGVHKCKKKVEHVVQKLGYKYCLQIDKLLIGKELSMKSNYQVYKITKNRGVNCFGFTIYPDTTKLRRSIANAFSKRCLGSEIELSLSAYYGWIKHLPNGIGIWNKALCGRSMTTKELVTISSLTSKIRNKYEKNRK